MVVLSTMSTEFSSIEETQIFEPRWSSWFTLQMVKKVVQDRAVRDFLQIQAAAVSAHLYRQRSPVPHISLTNN
jgi:hypothetical protein